MVALLGSGDLGRRRYVALVERPLAQLVDLAADLGLLPLQVLELLPLTGSGLLFSMVLQPVIIKPCGLFCVLGTFSIKPVVTIERFMSRVRRLISCVP